MSGCLDISLVLAANAVQPSSIPFRCQRPHVIQSYTGENIALTARDGITIMSIDDGRKVKKEKFLQKVVAPCDYSSLNHLADQLKQITEEVADITITEYSLTWGVKDGLDPCLIQCKGSYECNESVSQFKNCLPAIVLFLARELNEAVEPGTCFTRRSACRAATMTATRQCVVIHRAKRMSEAFHVDGRDLVLYVHRKLDTLRPGLLLERVPVCKTCFSVYDRASVPGRVRDENVRLPRVSEPRDKRMLPSGLRMFHSFALDSAKRARQTYMSSYKP